MFTVEPEQQKTARSEQRTATVESIAQISEVMQNPQAQHDVKPAESSRHFGFEIHLYKRHIVHVECARAFLGSPELVILEQPMLELPGENLSSLINATLHRRDAGGAVLWITSDRRIWCERAINPSRRYSFAGSRVVAAESL